MGKNSYKEVLRIGELSLYRDQKGELFPACALHLDALEYKDVSADEISHMMLSVFIAFFSQKGLSGKESIQFEEDVKNDLLENWDNSHTKSQRLK